MVKGYQQADPTMTLTASDVESISTSLSRWELGEYIFEALVILACAGELIADLGRLPGLWKSRIERWSTMLLVVALSMELICLVRTNQLSGDVITSAKNAAAEAEAKLADRILTDEQVRSIAAKVSVFSGQTYTVTAYWDSKESLGLANRIYSALLLARWSYSEEGSKSMMLGGEIGVLVWTHPDAEESTKKAAASLIDALNTEGIEAAPRLQNPKNPKSNMINVNVGANR